MNHIGIDDMSRQETCRTTTRCSSVPPVRANAVDATKNLSCRQNRFRFWDTNALVNNRIASREYLLRMRVLIDVASINDPCSPEFHQSTRPDKQFLVGDPRPASNKHRSS